MTIYSFCSTIQVSKEREENQILTEEQRRERKRLVNEEYAKYVEKYREGDTFYHVTMQENVESLLKNGFDPNMIGSSGGCQGGAGFSVTWTEMDAWQWGDKFYGWGRGDLVVVKIPLPGVKLATHQEIDNMRQNMLEWGKEQDYCDPDQEKFVSTEKLKSLAVGEYASTGWILTGLYLRSQGYDGYMVGVDEVVIINFDLLKSSAFSKMSNGSN